MLINKKLNCKDQKMLQTEAVHTCNIVQNSIETKGSTNIPFEFFYGEKPNIIGQLSEFGCITYATKGKRLRDK